MAYIGRDTDKLSNIEKLDVITFDGSSSYTLQKNSVNFTPNSANSLQVSIDGVVQAGNFTVSGSTIDFGVAIPSTSTNDFIFHYGTGLITTPADGTVSLAKLSATGTKDATTFLRGDNTFAEAGGGKVLQVIQANEQTARSTTSTSFVSLTFNASITPSSTSSKILVILSGTLSVIGSQGSAYINIDRGGTLLSSSTNGFTGAGIVGDFPTNTEKVPLHISFLDTPSTTSAVTYTLYGKASSGKTCTVNNGGLYETSFILMEIGA